MIEHDFKVSTERFIDYMWFFKDTYTTDDRVKEGDTIILREYDNKRFTGYFKAMIVKTIEHLENKNTLHLEEL